MYGDDVEKWKKAFAAQSMKLQAVLDCPGVREILQSMDWSEEGELVKFRDAWARMQK